jgi:hypothetical protein
MRKTCPSGHDLTLPNAVLIVQKSGQVQCRECRKLDYQRRRDKLRAIRAETIKRYG